MGRGGISMRRIMDTGYGYEGSWFVVMKKAGSSEAKKHEMTQPISTPKRNYDSLRKETEISVSK